MTFFCHTQLSLKQKAQGFLQIIDELHRSTGVNFLRTKLNQQKSQSHPPDYELQLDGCQILHTKLQQKSQSFPPNYELWIRCKFFVYQEGYAFESKSMRCSSGKCQNHSGCPLQIQGPKVSQLSTASTQGVLQLKQVQFLKNMRILFLSVFHKQLLHSWVSSEVVCIEVRVQHLL